MSDSSFDAQPPGNPGRPDPQSRESIDPQGAVGAPPPPPPGAYPPQWGPPPQPKRGLFGSITKLFSALSVCAVLFALGYYVALFTVLGSGGAVSTSTYQTGEGEDRIAIIPVTGMIQPETASFVRKAAQTAIDDPTIKAVILYVDSGGGMVGPSEQIYHHLQRLKEERNIPIIASFGGIAASGGYYIACATDYIYAQPACVTGSIGVIGQGMTFEKLLVENGIQPLVVTAQTSKDKDTANSFLQQWDSKDIEALQGILTDMHKRFVTVVKEGRGEVMSEQQLAATTTGKAYMTDDALEQKLIDEVGYLDDAIAKARAEGNISAKRPPVVMYRAKTSLMQSLIGARQDGGGSLNLDLNADKIRNLMMELGSPRPMYWYQP